MHLYQSSSSVLSAGRDCN